MPGVWPLFREEWKQGQGEAQRNDERKSRVFLNFFSQGLKSWDCYNYPPTDCTFLFEMFQKPETLSGSLQNETLRSKNLEEGKTGGGMTVLAQYPL